MKSSSPARLGLAKRSPAATRRGRDARAGCAARRRTRAPRASLAPATVATYAATVRDSDALAQAGRLQRPLRLSDVVIANAGISRGFLTELPEDLPALRAIFETNVYASCTPSSPSSRDGGAALGACGIASVAGFRGMPGSGAYCARSQLRSRTWRACASRCARAASTSSRSAPASSRRSSPRRTRTACRSCSRRRRGAARRARDRAAQALLRAAMAMALSAVLRVLRGRSSTASWQNRKRKPRDNRI